MVFTIGLIIYSIIAVIHLIFCFIESDKGRMYSKIFLLASLLFVCLLSGINTGNLLVLLMLGIIFGMFGDILVSFDDNNDLFIFGVFSFFVSHCLYIAEIIRKLPFKIELYFYIILLFFLLIWCLVLTPRIKPFLNELSVGVSIYSFTLVFGVSIGFITLLTSFSGISIMITLGFILLIISNVILFVATFYKSFRRYHFYLMIPYILGQAFIVYGILMR